VDMSGSLILRKKYPLPKFKELFLFLFIITFLGNCTKEIISSNNTPEFSFTVSYFNYNNHTNKIFFYTEIENITNVSFIDSVWVLLYNEDGDEINSSELNPEYPDSNFNSMISVYSSVITLNNLEPDVYFVAFNMQDQLGNHFDSQSERRYLTTNTNPVKPEIIGYSIPGTFALHPTEWTILPIELYIFDENGLEDILKVEYKTLRIFNGCNADNNNNGIINEPISDNDYTNLGFDDWLLIFNRFGPNNIFIYTIEIPMRPFDGSALIDSDGNVLPGFEATDCGRTGDVFFKFQATDNSDLTDSIEDIHIEIIAP
tara:strand:+ start:76 stop:1020 length:945 start_codon:yes stop_codon:yes gene_type:complete